LLKLSAKTSLRHVSQFAVSGAGRKSFEKALARNHRHAKFLRAIKQSDIVLYAIECSADIQKFRIGYGTGIVFAQTSWRHFAFTPAD